MNTESVRHDPDYTVLEILQVRSSDLLTKDEARAALKRIRPEWYGDAK